MSRACFGLAVVGIVALFYVGAGLLGDGNVPSAHAQQQQRAASSEATFSVSAGGQSSVLVDTHSGRTWLLRLSEDSTTPAAWLPIFRIDNPEEAAKWHTAEAARSKVWRETQRLELEKANDTDRLRELISQLRAQEEKTVNLKTNPLILQLQKEIAVLKAKLDEQ